MNPVDVLRDLESGKCDPSWLETKSLSASRNQRAICRHCPVLLTCAIYTADMISRIPVIGTWAGITYTTKWETRI